MQADIERINGIIESHFVANPDLKIIPAKDLMPAFIKAGVFTKDNKNGKPIRDFLKDLQRNDQLGQIPFVHTVQENKSTFWYFVPTNTAAPTQFYKREDGPTKREIALQVRNASDKTYVLDLCDAVLEVKAEREKRFNFLIGDLQKDGRTYTKLPVDAYYGSLKLAVEFHEASHDETPTRAEQRAMYEKRRATELPKNDITLIVIPFEAFKADAEQRIIRNEKNDLKIVKQFLKEK